MARAVDEDDTLALFFMCAHPELTTASSIALTLRAVGGLTTAEIARAFLVPEATMAQRISRAKRTIKASGVAFRLPSPDDEPPAVRSVLHVLYLIFNEGYASSSGRDLQRVDLSDEAIRLATLAHGQLPDDAEVAGLLALMLLIDARRPARVDAKGDVVPLSDQDRSLWDRGQIAEGTAMLDGAIGRGRVGEYQIQAAIAAIHDRAPTAADTDWPQILALYGLLERMTGNPVVTLNRAVAAGMADGPAAGLAILDGMDGALKGTHRFEAVRAHLLEMAGDSDGAIEHYRAAARLATNLPEQRYLTRQASQDSRPVSPRRSSDPVSLIWPRISPPGQVAVWMFAYAMPARIARRISPNCPAAMPWPVGPWMSAAVTSPSTVPSTFGQGSGFVPPRRGRTRRRRSHSVAPKWTCANEHVAALEPAVGEDEVERRVVDERRSELARRAGRNRLDLLVAIEVCPEFPRRRWIGQTECCGARQPAACERDDGEAEGDQTTRPASHAVSSLLRGRPSSGLSCRHAWGWTPGSHHPVSVSTCVVDGRISRVRTAR